MSYDCCKPAFKMLVMGCIEPSIFFNAEVSLHDRLSQPPCGGHHHECDNEEGSMFRPLQFAVAALLSPIQWLAAARGVDAPRADEGKAVHRNPDLRKCHPTVSYANQMIWQ